MTTKAKTPSEETTEEPAAVEETRTEAPRCGVPHHLALLAHLTCTKDAGHDLQADAGEAERKHRAVHDGTVYVWH